MSLIPYSYSNQKFQKLIVKRSNIYDLWFHSISLNAKYALDIVKSNWPLDRRCLWSLIPETIINANCAFCQQLRTSRCLSFSHSGMWDFGACAEKLVYCFIIAVLDTSGQFERLFCVMCYACIPVTEPDTMCALHVKVQSSSSRQNVFEAGWPMLVLWGKLQQCWVRRWVWIYRVWCCFLWLRVPDLVRPVISTTVDGITEFVHSRQKIIIVAVAVADGH